MNKKFSDFKEGEYVYVVYDKNYDKRYDKSYSFNSYYVLETAQIIKNNLEAHTFCNSDRYDDTEYIKNEYNFEIQTSSLKYSRYYDEFYDKQGHMTITSSSCGSYIEVFANKNEAQDYIYNICNNGINTLNDKISKLQEQIKLYKKSIENTKNYGQ